MATLPTPPQTRVVVWKVKIFENIFGTYGKGTYVWAINEQQQPQAMTTATNNTANRERIARIIRELQARTTANGCTEAEALAAAEKLDELLRQYDMTIDEASVAGDKYGARKRPYATGVKANVWHPGVTWCAAMVAKFTSTKCLLMRDGSLMFFGTAQDTELAFYLIDMIRSAIDGAWASEYKNLRALGRDGGRSMSGRAVGASFRIAMAQRIGERLKEMMQARDAQAPNANTGLVLVKKSTVLDRYHAWMAQNGYRAKAYRGGGRVSSYHGAAAGRAAGDRVSLNRPVGSGTTSAHRIG